MGIVKPHRNNTIGYVENNTKAVCFGKPITIAISV